MSPINAYQSNLSNDEFLKTAFLLMRKKVERVLELKKKEPLELSLLQEKHEKASQVMQSIVLLQSLLDSNSPVYDEAVAMYNELQVLLYKGNNEDSKYLEYFLKRI